jgi:hypothetical protein
MTELSPAARSVFESFNSKFDWVEDGVPGPQFKAIAAALRAAADQVVPWRPEPTEDSVRPTIDYGYAWALFSKANDVRQELIAIADELEAQ